jgi:hypothetical protein
VSGANLNHESWTVGRKNDQLAIADIVVGKLQILFGNILVMSQTAGHVGWELTSDGFMIQMRVLPAAQSNK